MARPCSRSQVDRPALAATVMRCQEVSSKEGSSIKEGDNGRAIDVVRKHPSDIEMLHPTVTAPVVAANVGIRQAE